MLNLATERTGTAEGAEALVLQTALNDFYVSYELNAYTTGRWRCEDLLDLHQNIQDVFNEHGVQIMSPITRDPRRPRSCRRTWFPPPAKQEGCNSVNDPESDDVPPGKAFGDNIYREGDSMNSDAMRKRSGVRCRAAACSPYSWSGRLPGAAAGRPAFAEAEKYPISSCSGWAGTVSAMPRHRRWMRTTCRSVRISIFPGPGLDTRPRWCA